jgi:hypothetical protein
VPQKNDVDAAVLQASVLGGVAGDGVELGVAGGGEVGWIDGAVLENQTGDGGGTGSRELPVGGELRGVDGDVVGVAFDTERTWGQGGGKHGEHWDGRGADLRGPRGKEARFMQRDDQTVRSDAYGDAAGTNAPGGYLFGEEF